MKPAASWEIEARRNFTQESNLRNREMAMGSPNLHPHRTGKLKTLAASTVTYMKPEHQGKDPAIYAISLLTRSFTFYLLWNQTEI